MNLQIGACLIAICIVIFHLSVEAKRPKSTTEPAIPIVSTTPSLPQDLRTQWRTTDPDECLLNEEPQCPEDFGDKPVILLALGSLTRHQIEKIPALKELIKCGVKAESLVPSYPTLSYPNLYSIATGLYPESHGIVGDDMFDKNLNATFKRNLPSSFMFDWWSGEPIWDTLRKQNKRYVQYPWPVFSRSPQGHYFTEEKILLSRRMDKIIEWIELPQTERPHLLMIYYDDLQKAVQDAGLTSNRASNELDEINSSLDILMSSLKSSAKSKCVNLIVLSDHGVAKGGCKEKTIFISDYIDDFSSFKYYIDSVGRIQTEDPKVMSHLISKLQCKNKNVKVLKEFQMPKRYHYTNNERIGNLVLETSVGYHIAFEETEKECFRGTFGHDILTEEMQGVFVAYGPSFQAGKTTKSFRNVEIYNLLCSLINVQPSPNNGTNGGLRHIMNSDKMELSKSEVVFLKENIKSRPNRPGDGVLKGQCKCDASHLKKKENITTVAPTTPISDTSTPITSTTSSTTTQSSMTSQSSTTTQSSTTSQSSTTTQSSSTTTQSSKTQRTTIQPGNLTTSSPTTVNVDINGNLSTIETSRKKRSTSNENDMIKDDDEHEKNSLMEKHCPYGCPQYSEPEKKSDVVEILLQTNYIIGHIRKLNTGIWISFTINKSYMDKLKAYKPAIPEGVHKNPEDDIKEIPKGCWIADPRLNRTISNQCDEFQEDEYIKKNATLRQLFPDELEYHDILASEIFFLSNLAPLLLSYKEGGRKLIIKFIEKLVEKNDKVNVQHGPVFDYDLDGRKDDVDFIWKNKKTIIPSNYFYVITICDLNDVKDLLSNCTILSFVFPNEDSRDKCETDEKYLEYHMTNLADVELLTGLRFFRSIKDEDHAQLRIQQPLYTIFKNLI